MTSEYRPQSPCSFTIDEASKKGAEPLQPHLSEDNVIWKEGGQRGGDTGEGFGQLRYIVIEGSSLIPPMQHTGDRTDRTHL